MSEYQYIAFRAIDAPVSSKNLAYMRRQSTRAEITPWSFENEYHFGDFSGDAYEMLRRGYEFHFHYANFGYRTLMIRLPHGLPNAKAAASYFETDSLHFVKDKKGPGGILCIEPAYEPGQLEELWEPQAILEPLLPLRAEIQAGDLRPLYLARLAISMDLNHIPEEESATPVPAGLNKLTKAQRALAELYELSEALIAAAAGESPPLPLQAVPGESRADWLAGQPEALKNEWLGQLMNDPHAGVRAEILAAYQRNQSVPTWPTATVTRSVADIMTAAEAIQEQMNRRSAEKAARARAEKLAAMAADPTATLRETEQLVKEHSTESYKKIALLLADLRTALGSSDQAILAEHQARKLRIQNPNLRSLPTALRRQGFLKKA